MRRDGKPLRRRRPKRKYESHSLFTQIAFRLSEPGRQVTVDELQAELRVGERRRIQRYLAGLRFGVFNGVFHGMVLRLEDAHGREVPADVDDVEHIPETRIDRARLLPAVRLADPWSTGRDAETVVDLEILDRETERRLRDHAVHPSQRLLEAASGRTVLRLTMRGSIGLVGWILGQGASVRVLAPATLRDEVAGLARAIAALYEGT